MNDTVDNEPTPEEIAATFNATNIAVEVDEASSDGEFEFRYFQGRDEVTRTTNGSGRITLGGNREPRSYVYTWLTSFGEESIPSEPSEEVYVRTGEAILLTGLPTSPPLDDLDYQPHMIRGIRLYRSIATPSGAEYFRVGTFWFPNTVDAAYPEGGENYWRPRFPHGLIVGDRVNVNGTIAEVTATRDRFVFTVDNLAMPTGTLYYDVAETLEDDPRWWGLDGDYSFLDDFDQGGLSIILPSLNYEAPPLEIKGFVLLPNNILAGFMGSRLYLSEPNEYHAFPSENIIKFDYPIVGLAVSAGTLVVLTEGYPYRVDGNSPESMTPNKIDSMYPCLSKESIVVTGAGVTYSTHSGLATYNPGSGAMRATRVVFDRRAWKEFFDDFDPSQVSGFEYEDKYIGVINVPNGNQRYFVFEPDQQTGGHITLLSMSDNYEISADFVNSNSRTKIETGWTDPSSGNLYLVSITPFDNFVPARSVYLFDSGADLPAYWRSKDMKIPGYTNVGAVRCSYKSETADPIRLELFVDGEVINAPYSEIPNKTIIRLPAGYKADSFEVSVNTMGTATEIRSIHIGETPLSLQRV